MIRRASFFQDGVLVKTGMWGRIVAASERSFIGLLLAMVRKRLAGNLPSTQAASVGKGGQENSINRAALLQDVNDLLGALVHERNGADLDSERLPFGRNLRCGRSGQEQIACRCQTGNCPCSAFEKISSRQWFSDQIDFVHGSRGRERAAFECFGTMPEGSHAS